MTADPSRPGALLVTERPIAGQPLLVSGPASAALLDATGEFTLLREARGGVEQWGGVYAQETRLTGPWTLTVIVDGEPFVLPSTLCRLEQWRWGVESSHRLGRLALVQRVAASGAAPGVGRTLELTNPSDRPLQLCVRSEWVPFLAPVLLEGVKPPEYAARTTGPTLRAESHGFGLAIDADPLPHRLTLDGRPWIGGRWKGELGRLGSEADLTLAPGATASVRWFVWGGLERTIDAAPSAGTVELRDAASWSDRARATYEAWEASTPQLGFPDDPLLEEGYRLARGALRQLYERADPAMTGLVAGYPWYSTVWCRDLAWMLPAVLWLGDHRWASDALRSVFRFQSPSALPILGAERGELPMQFSPGPIFLYGTSDTTLYYPGLVRRLAAHGADLSPLREFAPHLAEVAAWMQRKVDPASGLIRNGGEVGRMQQATSGVGRVRYGFDAVDTTIWDSTDRRDHAVDVVALWAQALRDLADLHAGSDSTGVAESERAMAAGIARRLRTEYWWPEERYLYDSRHLDGRPVAKLRPNALRAVALGLLPGAQAREVVQRAARPDLTAPWGVRTLGSGSPDYVPTAYHDGQVWPIATAWAAEAALCTGDSALAMTYLHTLAQMLVREAGYANECYRGDRAEPFDSCFLLGFSVGPFLSVLFERLWGISVGLDRTLSVQPGFPPEWTAARLHGLRLGEGAVDLDWRPDRLEVGWKGEFPLVVRSGGQQATLTPGTRQELALSPPAPQKP